MRIIISETQQKVLITERISDELSDSLKNMKEFTKKVLSETQIITGLDFSFLLSWGATLGGLMMPVSQFIEGKYPELSTTDIYLLITGAIASYFSSNKKMLSKLLNIIKEKGLVKIFDELLESTSLLKNTFLDFIDSLNITTSKMSNMLAYTFLIPILPTLYNMAQMSYDQDVINEIVKRLLGYGVVVVSSVTLKEIIRQIINRFRS